jgi:hypothetical protein
MEFLFYFGFPFFISLFPNTISKYTLIDFGVFLKLSLHKKIGKIIPSGSVTGVARTAGVLSLNMP